MKKTSFTVGIILFALVACVQTPSTQSSIDETGHMATIVAGTLSAIPTNTLLPTETLTLNSSETPSPEPSPMPPTQCNGEYSGIILTMPNTNWNCSIEVLQDGAEVIYIYSPVFEIRTAYGLGRGLWCEPNSDENCVATSFYENELVKLSLYKWHGENKEIFGIILLADDPIPISLSIKYLDMEKRDLTQIEMSELIFFIDTIMFE